MSKERQRSGEKPTESERDSGGRLISLIVVALSGLVMGLIIGALLF